MLWYTFTPLDCKAPDGVGEYTLHCGLYLIETGTASRSVIVTRCPVSVPLTESDPSPQSVPMPVSEPLEDSEPISGATRENKRAD